MQPHPRHQFHLVGQLDQVVVRPGLEGQPLDLRVLLHREHHDRRLHRRGLRAQLPHQLDAVHARHHQILKNHRGLQLGRDLQGLQRVRAVMEGDVRVAGQGAPHRLRHDRLVVHQQDHAVVA